MCGGSERCLASGIGKMMPTMYPFSYHSGSAATCGRQQWWQRQQQCCSGSRHGPAQWLSSSVVRWCSVSDRGPNAEPDGYRVPPLPPQPRSLRFLPPPPQPLAPSFPFSAHRLSDSSGFAAQWPRRLGRLEGLSPTIIGYAMSDFYAFNEFGSLAWQKIKHI